MSEENFVAVSGGFDPVTIGHVRMFYDAAAFGKVVILLNSDSWLIRKKKYVFMPFEERKQILEGFRSVHCVLPAMDTDDTVNASLESLRNVIHYFGKGGDRTIMNTPELDTCNKFEIKVLFGLGGGKVQSSSALVKNAIRGLNEAGTRNG